MGKNNTLAGSRPRRSSRLRLSRLKKKERVEEGDRFGGYNLRNRSNPPSRLGEGAPGKRQGRRSTLRNTLDRGRSILQRALSIATGIQRRGFSDKKSEAARLEATLATGIDHSKFDLSKKDKAPPHRAPYSKLRDLVFDSKITPELKKEAIEEFTKASIIYEEAFERTAKRTGDERYNRLATIYRETRLDVENALREYMNNPDSTVNKESLVYKINNLASNAPGLGPHNTTNNPVRNRLHVNPETEGYSEPLTPRSRAAVRVFGDIVPVATTEDGSRVVSVTGALVSTFPSNFFSLKKDVKAKSVTPYRATLNVRDGKVYRPKGDSDWEEV